MSIQTSPFGFKVDSSHWQNEQERQFRERQRRQQNGAWREERLRPTPIKPPVMKQNGVNLNGKRQPSFTKQPLWKPTVNDQPTGELTPVGYQFRTRAPAKRQRQGVVWKLLRPLMIILRAVWRFLFG